MTDPESRIGRKKRRRWLRVVVVLSVFYVLGVAAGCMNPTMPFDLVVNTPPVPAFEALRHDGERPTLVVLQHGICRSAWSLWRLERALRQHGYDVLNPSYSSTQQSIEEHAATLERQVERHLAQCEGPEPDLAFVGHSMGGLVIRRYLERDRAREPKACVFIATPHRGAVLASKRKDLFVFKLFMGSRAGLQLEPGHEFYASLSSVRCARIGCIYGGAGDDEGWNDDIPGDDDGTVAVGEAQLPEQTDSVQLELGHTRISMADVTIRHVLEFLRNGEFAK